MGLGWGEKGRAWRPSAAYSDTQFYLLGLLACNPIPLVGPVYPCFLSLVFQLLLPQPSEFTPPSPLPSHPPPDPSLTGLRPPANALLPAELEHIPTVPLGPRGLKWHSCHPLVHPTKSSASFKALSSEELPWSLIDGSPPAGIRVTYCLSAMAPPLVTVFCRYVSFYF